MTDKYRILCCEEIKGIAKLELAVLFSVYNFPSSQRPTLP